jgi:DNA topoisomerase-1
LVKQLEELGIGRPSTYAPTISTIQNRNYIEKGTHEGDERAYKQLVFSNQNIKEKNLTEKVGSNKGKLVPTDVGFIVTDFLVNHFESILDYNFTARVEESFDDIAEGKEDWKAMMKDFYKGFHPQVEDVQENAERETGERVLGTDPKTGRQVSVRLGKFGPMVQIGTVDEEEKPQFASLSPDQQLNTITYEEAMDLFKLPKALGHYNDDEVEVNNGRFGPYVRYGKKFVSLPKGVDPLSVELDEAIIYIKEKEKADAPIYMYQGLEVTKGKGRFGPFIKWNNMFINVNKKYDWDNLSEEDIVTLIEDKIQKEKDKLIHVWEEEGIRVEKARWGRHNVIKGKQKVELAKTVDVSDMTLEEAKAILEKNAPKKKTRKTTKKKTTTKKK